MKGAVLIKDHGEFVLFLRNVRTGAHRTAQSVEHGTLDFGSGHDLMVHEFELRIWLHPDGVEPAWDSLSPSLAVPPHPLSQNK